MAKKLVRGTLAQWMNKYKPSYSQDGANPGKQLTDYKDSVVFLKDGDPAVGSHIFQNGVDFPTVEAISNLRITDMSEDDLAKKIKLEASALKVTDNTNSVTTGVHEYVLRHALLNTTKSGVTEGKTIDEASLPANTTFTAPAESETDASVDANSGFKLNDNYLNVVTDVTTDSTGHVSEIVIKKVQQKDEHVTAAVNHYLPNSDGTSSSLAPAGTVANVIDFANANRDDVTDGNQTGEDTKNTGEYVKVLTGLKTDSAKHVINTSVRNVPTFQYVDTRIDTFAASALEYKGTIAYGTLTDGNVTVTAPEYNEDGSVKNTPTTGTWYVNTGEGWSELKEYKVGEVYMVADSFVDGNGNVYEAQDTFISKAKKEIAEGETGSKFALSDFSVVNANWNVVNVTNAEWTQPDETTTDPITEIPVGKVANVDLKASIKTPVTSFNEAVGDLTSSYSGKYRAVKDVNGNYTYYEGDSVTPVEDSVAQNLAVIGTLELPGTDPYLLVGEAANSTSGNLIEIFTEDNSVNHSGVETTYVTAAGTEYKKEATLSYNSDGDPKGVVSTVGIKDSTNNTAEEAALLPAYTNTASTNKTNVITGLEVDGFGHVTKVTQSSVSDEAVNVTGTSAKFVLVGENSATALSANALNTDLVGNEGVYATTTYVAGSDTFNMNLVDGRGTVMSVNAVSVDWEDLDED